MMAVRAVVTETKEEMAPSVPLSLAYGFKSEKPVNERTYKGSVDCFNKVLAKEGLKGMYKGMVPELFRGVGGSLVIVAYDRIKVIFGI